MFLLIRDRNLIRTEMSLINESIRYKNDKKKISHYFEKKVFTAKKFEFLISKDPWNGMKKEENGVKKQGF